MGIYIVLMAILLISYMLLSSGGQLEIKGDSSRRRGYFYFLIFLLILLQALRSSSVGGDLFDNYERYYKLFGTANWAYIWAYQSHEIGYVILNKLAYIVSGGNLQFFLFVIACIYHLSLARIILKYSRNIYFSLFLYLTTSGFNVSMNELRSTLAVSVMLLALPSLIEGKKWKYLIAIPIAMFFHKTSICYLFIFVSLILDNWKKIVAFNLAAGGMFLLLVDRIFPLIARLLPKYSKYLMGTSESGSGGGGFLLLLLVVIIGVVFLLSDKQYLEERNNKVFFTILICAASLQVFTLSVHFFSRIVLEFFVISIPIVIPNFSMSNKISIRSRPIFNSVLVVAFAAFYIYSLIQNGSMTVPYTFYFQ